MFFSTLLSFLLTPSTVIKDKLTKQKQKRKTKQTNKQNNQTVNNMQIYRIHERDPGKLNSNFP